jgi:hypothetical protein
MSADGGINEKATTVASAVYCEKLKKIAQGHSEQKACSAPS